MPQNGLLSCSIELGDTNTRLREYGTTYFNRTVETYVAIPTKPTPFSVRVSSHGYIAPGLSVWVYIDGTYQTNRNKRGLLPPNGENARSSNTEFHLGQKEDLLRDGRIIARGWWFEKLNIVDADTVPTVNSYVSNNLGTIEVVVLRCQDDPKLKVLDPWKFPKLPSIEKPTSKENNNAQISESKPFNKQKEKTKLPSDDGGDGMAAFGVFGMGLFDGAGDENPIGAFALGGWDGHYDTYDERRRHNRAISYGHARRRSYDHRDAGTSTSSGDDEMRAPDMPGVRYIYNKASSSPNIQHSRSPRSSSYYQNDWKRSQRHCEADAKHYAHQRYLESSNKAEVTNRGDQRREPLHSSHEIDLYERELPKGYQHREGRYHGDRVVSNRAYDDYRDKRLQNARLFDFPLSPPGHAWANGRQPSPHVYEYPSPTIPSLYNNRANVNDSGDEVHHQSETEEYNDLPRTESFGHSRSNNKSGRSDKRRLTELSGSTEEVLDESAIPLYQPESGYASIPVIYSSNTTRMGSNGPQVPLSYVPYYNQHGFGQQPQYPAPPYPQPYGPADLKLRPPEYHATHRALVGQSSHIYHQYGPLAHVPATYSHVPQPRAVSTPIPRHAPPYGSPQQRYIDPRSGWQGIATAPEDKIGNPLSGFQEKRAMDEHALLGDPRVPPHTSQNGQGCWPHQYPDGPPVDKWIRPIPGQGMPGAWPEDRNPAPPIVDNTHCWSHVATAGKGRPTSPSINWDIPNSNSTGSDVDGWDNPKGEDDKEENDPWGGGDSGSNEKKEENSWGEKEEKKKEDNSAGWNISDNNNDAGNNNYTSAGWGDSNDNNDINNYNCNDNSAGWGNSNDNSGTTNYNDNSAGWGDSNDNNNTSNDQQNDDWGNNGGWGDEDKEKNTDKKKEKKESKSKSKSEASEPVEEKPYTRSYWKTRETVDKTDANSSRKRSKYTMPEDPIYTISEEKAKEKHLKHQVRGGKGAEQEKKTYKPIYWDTFEEPYAVFRFKYRSRDMLKKILGEDIQETKEEFKEWLGALSKEQLIAEMMRKKEAGGWSSDESSDTGSKKKKNDKKKDDGDGWNTSGGGGGNNKSDNWDSPAGRSGNTNGDAWDKPVEKAGNKGDSWQNSGGDAAEVNKNAVW